MILRIYGKINILFLLLFSLLFSCTNYNRNLFSGNVYKHYYSHYINDSILFSVKVAGDVNRNNDLKNLRQKLKQYDLKSFSSNVIDFFETTDEIGFDIFLLKFDNYPLFQTFIQGKQFGRINFQKDNSEVEFIDSLNYCYGKSVSNENNEFILILAYSRDKNKEHFDLLWEEFSEALTTMDASTTFKNILPSAFEIGFDNSQNTGGSINYLKPVAQLEEFAKVGDPNNFLFLQAICTYSSRISNSETFDYYFNKYKQRSQGLDVPGNNFTANNEAAIKMIVDLCNTSNLVMFNENHFDVRHRKLVRYLLKDLYNQGFRYLGLEALFEEAEQINARSFPIDESGFYTLEPEMGNLIREAASLGFEVFSYDDFGEEREPTQAKNIFKQTFEKDSTAKVLILGGFDHIVENEIHSKKWMAYYFHDLYKIDPLTFSQTMVNPNDTFWLGIIKNDSEKAVDYLISNNLTDSLFSEKYTTYLLTLDQNKNVNLLSIYLKNEYDKYEEKAVPVKNILVKSSITTLSIPLKHGEYVFTLKNEYGKILHNGILMNE